MAKKLLKEVLPPWLVTAFYYATRPWVWLLITLWRWGTEQHTVGPFVVFADDLRADEEAKISEAVDLIRDVDPVWHGRVKTHIHQLLLADHKGQLEGEYHPAARAVLIKRSVLAAVDASSVAALLIHKATHGHLQSRGVRQTAARLPRVERVCLRNEIRFLRRTGGNTGLALAKEERLDKGQY